MPPEYTVVFTNGCFDLLHPGHVDLLERARALGDWLVVGLNSDASVRAIKGSDRPLVPQEDRALMLRSLRCVDEVILFDDPTPARLIAALQPDILVKGGDWPVEQIVGNDTVLRKGGKVLSLPLKPDYSTTLLVERIQQMSSLERRRQIAHSEYLTTEDKQARALHEHLGVIQALLVDALPSIQRAGQVICQALMQGHKVLLCGNGGSATDAQHLAAEFVGRFAQDRRAWPAMALTTNISMITALGNDYGYEQIFTRQLEALAQPGDVVVAISTSGNSLNMLSAVMTARQVGCQTIALTGMGGKQLASLCDTAVMVPSCRTARIQEAHITIGHLWCEMVETLL